MAIKRYAVLNKSNVVMNVILVNDPMPKDYWPGYGNVMICLDPSPSNVASCGLNVLTLALNKSVDIGDTVNVSTGAVTKFVPSTVIDPTTGKTVNTAPNVPLTKDANPKST